MVLEVKSFNGTGADCSGSSGDSNRVLTLSNTSLTQQSGFLVYVSGLALGLTTEYTVSHLAASTTITFLNALTDSMTVVVNYFVGADTGLGSDFENGPLADFGVLVTRTPVTVTTDYHGQKVYTDEATNNISGVFNPYTKEYKLDKGGLTKVYDATLFIGPNTTLTKDDKITYDSMTYRVDKVSPRDFNGTPSFQMAGLFFIKDE